jgi:hypothetical protein
MTYKFQICLLFVVEIKNVSLTRRSRRIRCHRIRGEGKNKLESCPAEEKNGVCCGETKFGIAKERK